MAEPAPKSNLPTNVKIARGATNMNRRKRPLPLSQAELDARAEAAKAIADTKAREEDYAKVKPDDIPLGATDEAGPRTTDEQTKVRYARTNAVRSTRDARLRAKKEQKNEQAAERERRIFASTSASKNTGAGAVTAQTVLLRRANLNTATLVLILTALSIWSISMFFSFVALSGLGLTVITDVVLPWIPLIGEEVAGSLMTPGMLIFGAGYIPVVIFNLLTIIAIILYYTFRRIRVFRSPYTLVVLGFTVAFYLTPGIQFLPWTLGFIATVYFTNRF